MQLFLSLTNARQWQWFYVCNKLGCRVVINLHLTMFINFIWSLKWCVYIILYIIMIAQAIFIVNFIWLFSLYLLVELFVGMDGEWRLASLHHRRTKGWSSTLHIHQINKRVDIPGLKDSQASPTINPVNLTGKVVGKVARSQPPDERVEENIDTLSRIRGLCQY